MALHLINGIDYTVAISGVDAVGNVGQLSNNVCVVPVEVTDFFELYRQDGGKGGGGFCSVSRRPNRAPFGLFAIVGAAAPFKLAPSEGARGVREAIALSTRFALEKLAAQGLPIVKPFASFSHRPPCRARAPRGAGRSPSRRGPTSTSSARTTAIMTTGSSSRRSTRRSSFASGVTS